jgi:hypothetical protein
MCNYSEKIPGDYHILCVRKFNLEDIEKDQEKYMELAKAIRRLPKHAGIWPYAFNDWFVCHYCPFKNEEFNKDNVQKLDSLMALVLLRWLHV